MTKHIIEKQLTNIYGLRWLPVNKDSWDAGQHEPFSDCCKNVIESSMEELGSSLKCIVEIGVDRDGDAATMTKHILEHKRDDVIYLGVDINDKSYLDDSTKNVYTICTDSADRQSVIDKLAELGVELIDLLFIDGDHYIEMTVNDWQYAEQLSDHGTILMHDIDGHVGPYCVFDAVDPAMFDKTKLCMEDDYGMGKLRRTVVNI